MNRGSLVFCLLAPAITLAVSAIGFHYAALPPEKIAAARTAVTPDRLPVLNLGAFGEVSGIDLMAYWMEHPPTAQPSDAPTPATTRFGGC